MDISYGYTDAASHCHDCRNSTTGHCVRHSTYSTVSGTSDWREWMEARRIVIGPYAVPPLVSTANITVGTCEKCGNRWVNYGDGIRLGCHCLPTAETCEKCGRNYIQFPDGHRLGLCECPADEDR